MANLLEKILGELNTIHIISIVFLILTWIAVVLRIYVRTRLIRAFGGDDWSILIAQAFYTITCVSSIVLVDVCRDVVHGKSTHINLLTMVKLDTGFYILAMIALKVSLGIFFLKIFLTSKWRRIVIHFVVALSVSYGIGYLFLTTCTCALSTFFGSSGSTCSIEVAYGRVSTSWSIFNMLTDFAFSLLAVIAIWSVNLPAFEKISASGLLVLGTGGGIASCIRLAVILEPSHGSIMIVHGLVSGRWTIIEIGIGIFAASLATLRPLFRRIKERSRSKFTSSSSKPMGIVQSALGPKARASAPDWRTMDESEDWEKGVAACTASNSEAKDDDEKGVEDYTHRLQTHDLISEATIGSEYE